MNKQSQRTVKAGKILSYIAILLVIVAICGSLAYFTNGFTSDFKTFYIESNGHSYLSDTNNYVLSQSESNKFDVKYTFGALNKEINGYSIKIVPNVSNDNDFDFNLDGETYSFGAETDLTKGFTIQKYDTYFVIDGDYTMRDVLEKAYPNQAVEFNPEDVNWEVDNFTLQVYSYNGEALVSIGFHNYSAVTGVELQEELVFEEALDGTVHAR